MFAIETKTPNGWWLMPYRFETRAQAEADLAVFVAKNEGREFRVVSA
jgi:hypothetical protein